MGSLVDNAVGWHVAGRVLGEKASDVNVTLASFEEESSASGVAVVVIDWGVHALLEVVNGGDVFTAVDRPPISAKVRPT